MRQPPQRPKKRARAPDLQLANDEVAADYMTKKMKKAKTDPRLTQEPEDCPDCLYNICQCRFMYVDSRPGVRPRQLADDDAPFTDEF